MKRLIYPIVSFMLLLTSCNFSDGHQCKAGPKTVNLNPPQTATALSTIQLLGDSLGANAYNEIADKFDKHTAFRMNVYDLRLTKEENEIFNQDEMNHLVQKRNKKVAANGDWRHAWFFNSGFEHIFDETRHYRMEGVDPSQLQDDSFYLYKAQAFIENELKPETSGHYQYYPYKKKNAVTFIDKDVDGNANDMIVDEVGVAYASKLDGWPVIGSGGKIYVHMLPNGDVVSHSVYRKMPQNAIMTLTENDIKSPDEAFSEMLTTADINPNDIHIVRQEFGYYFRGKNSIQNIIAPYYIYIVQYNDPESSMLLLRPVLAVKGDKANQILEDEALETDRKFRQLNGIDPNGDIGYENL